MRYFIDSLNHNLSLIQKERKGNNKLPRKILILLKIKDLRKKPNKAKKFKNNSCTNDVLYLYFFLCIDFVVPFFLKSPAPLPYINLNPGLPLWGPLFLSLYE